MFIKVEDIDLHAAIPRQVHLALTGDPREMVVMWATRTINVLSIVEVWPIDRPARKKQFRGNIATLEGTPTVIHTVLIQGLHRGVKYGYRVGDPTIDTWCREYWFETRPRKAAQTRFVALGDLDLQEDGTRQNIEFLREHIIEFDILILLGDICYKWGDALDEIGEALEPITAIRPTMVLPGNHEYEKRDDLGFHAFNTRWHMPDNGYLNQWYSFNLGNLHFVALSTEDSLEPTSKQGKWLLRDLKNATARGDWILLMAHKTPVGSFDKKWLRNKSHVLFRDLQQYLPKFDIKLSIWGHIHAYERTHPIDGVVYVTIGVGGARLDTEFVEPQPDYSVHRQAEFGACFFQFDHVLSEMTMNYRSSGAGETLDSFTISTLPMQVPNSALLLPQISPTRSTNISSPLISARSDMAGSMPLSSAPRPLQPGHTHSPSPPLFTVDLTSPTTSIVPLITHPTSPPPISGEGDSDDSSLSIGVPSADSPTGDLETSLRATKIAPLPSSIDHPLRDTPPVEGLNGPSTASSLPTAPSDSTDPLVASPPIAGDPSSDPSPSISHLVLNSSPTQSS